MRVTRMPFSLLLPLGELALTWALLVPLQTGFAYYRLREAAGNSDGIRIRSGQFDLSLRRQQFLFFAFGSTLVRQSHRISALNLPGGFVQGVISLPTSRPGIWHPALTLDSWRSLTFPFFCLPAWWFVGNGLDGLLGRKRLPIAILLSGSIFCLLFLTAIPGYFTSPPSDQADLRWLMPGVGFWAIAFGILPVTWFRQWRQVGSPNALK
jgi:hypothetical protein